ncbi:hypothetical protein POM88_012615 [Heracleum sosnowskyi]|uniref:Uncharacterized protein n=1 Tax=Heracleum sosnowskyi TaxID=360622 RepID=A0AAD8N1W0_9APIA|nr:hypothetical protein POM88_012615 [Heracleum sosnowskyi]
MEVDSGRMEPSSSRQSSILSVKGGVQVEVDGDVKCEGRESSDYCAAVVQRFYRGYRTCRLLADSVEELWWQAINYARLNHSSISFFNFSLPETISSRWIRISLNASKVGKGLSKDAKGQKLAFQHWIEAIDP